EEVIRTVKTHCFCSSGASKSPKSPARNCSTAKRAICAGSPSTSAFRPVTSSTRKSNRSSPCSMRSPSRLCHFMTVPLRMMEPNSPENVIARFSTIGLLKHLQVLHNPKDFLSKQQVYFRMRMVPVELGLNPNTLQNAVGVDDRKV